jgi:hypothetical protein
MAGGKAEGHDHAAAQQPHALEDEGAEVVTAANNLKESPTALLKSAKNGSSSSSESSSSGGSGGYTPYGYHSTGPASVVQTSNFMV